MQTGFSCKLNIDEGGGKLTNGIVVMFGLVTAECGKGGGTV